MIELTSVVISERFRCHILWIGRNLTEFYEIVIFVNSVPRYKLDGHWLMRFQINQSHYIQGWYCAILFGESSVGLAHECYFNMALFVIR
jgi:hypothetical protein